MIAIDKEKSEHIEKVAKDTNLNDIIIAVRKNKVVNGTTIYELLKELECGTKLV